MEDALMNEDVTPVPDENKADYSAENKEYKSALQDNIEKKGKNAYYFAHAHKVRWCLNSSY